MRKILVLLCACLVTTGCDKIQSLAGAQPGATSTSHSMPTKMTYEINLTSPDNALKTWWRYKNASSQFHKDVCLYMLDEMAGVDTYAKVSTGEVLESKLSYETAKKCDTDIYDHEIKEIKQETETRAIAFVKVTNATPSPKVPTERETKIRNEGEELKYLIEKVDGNWLVAQVYTYDKNYALLGRDSPWEKKYKLDSDLYPMYIFEY